MRSRHWIFLACLQIATLAACGDDDGDGDGDSNGGGGNTTTVDTGLTPTAKLSSLDDDDAQKACIGTAHTFNTVLPDSKWEEVGCAILGIAYVDEKNGGDSDESDIAECESIAKKCVSGDPIDGQIADVKIEIANESSCDDASATKTFGDCEATVADYERCAGKLASELKKRFSGVTCDGIKDVAKFQAELGADIDIGSSEECKTLRTKCPDLDLSNDTSTEIDTGDEG
jgi:hypothetical protein